MVSAHAASAPPRAVQAAMDDLLCRHGAYIPVELLLALGRLRYTDYEAWRCGERPSLQSALAGNPRRVLALLEAAAQWAGQLGLQPEPRDYFGWGAYARHRLAFLEPEWQRAEPLLATHYIRAGPAANGGQFDLFFDSGTTAILQALRACLRARDPAGAEQALTELIAAEPGHQLRPAAEQLTDALAHLSTPLPAETADAGLRALEENLVPAARDLFGTQARDALAPFWQRLAHALEGRAFEPTRPALHASHAWTGCLDWPRAIAAIEAVPDHAAHPALLARLANARHHHGDRHGAIAAWCTLCWRAPDAARAELDAPELPDPAVRQARLAFRDLDLESPPEDSFFPAWLLLTEPGLAWALRTDLTEEEREGPPETAFDAVRRLLRQDGTDARKALRRAAPWLLDAYLDVHAAQR